MLGDDTGAVGLDLYDGEAEVDKSLGRVAVSAGEVGARDVGGALDEVAGHEGARELI